MDYLARVKAKRVKVVVRDGRLKGASQNIEPRASSKPCCVTATSRGAPTLRRDLRICPVAYQMSTSARHGNALGLAVPGRYAILDGCYTVASGSKATPFTFTCSIHRLPRLRWRDRHGP